MLGLFQSKYKAQKLGVSIPDLFQNLDSFFSCRLIYLCFLSSFLCCVKSDAPACPKYTRLLSLVIKFQGRAARAQSGGRRRDHLYNLIVRHARRSNPRARESHGPPPSRSHCAPPRAGAVISAL
jgi:hypothetical protein